MSEILVSGLLIIGSILHATIKKLNLIKLGKTKKAFEWFVLCKWKYKWKLNGIRFRLYVDHNVPYIWKYEY